MRQCLLLHCCMHDLQGIREIIRDVFAHKPTLFFFSVGCAVRTVGSTSDSRVAGVQFVLIRRFHDCYVLFMKLPSAVLLF